MYFYVHPIETIEGFYVDKILQEVWILTCDHWILYSDYKIYADIEYLTANGVPVLD